MAQWVMRTLALYYAHHIVRKGEMDVKELKIPRACACRVLCTKLVTKQNNADSQSIACILSAKPGYWKLQNPGTATKKDEHNFVSISTFNRLFNHSNAET